MPNHLSFLNVFNETFVVPIQPLSELFMHFMVLVDTSTRWSHMCLLSTCNHAFAKLIMQVI
jgi:hypothetical protein